jgi:DHA1 family bicyclomycin/chloramphenicol resistance-like MFS transporter
MAASQTNRWLATRVEARRIVGVVLGVAMAASLILLFDAYSGFGGFAGILVPLFFYIACHGFVLPNTTALAMAPHGKVAGSASALLGTVQFVLASVTGALVAALANGTPVPLAAVIAGCGVAAFVSHHFGGGQSAASLSAGSAA